MPAGPLGWTRRTRREHRCKFVSMAWELASAEVDFVAWIGPKLLRHIEGFASFHLHLSLLLPRGGFEGWGVVRWRGMVVFALGWWRGGG